MCVSLKMTGIVTPGSQGQHELSAHFTAWWSPRELSPGRLWDVGGGSGRCDILKFHNLGLSLLTSGGVHDTLACLTGSGKNLPG